MEYGILSSSYNILSSGRKQGTVASFCNSPLRVSKNPQTVKTQVLIVCGFLSYMQVYITLLKFKNL